jgi:hypothetical protein
MPLSNSSSNSLNVPKLSTRNTSVSFGTVTYSLKTVFQPEYAHVT